MMEESRVEEAAKKAKKSIFNIKVVGVQGPARMHQDGVTEGVQDLLRKLLTENVVKIYFEDIHEVEHAHVGELLGELLEARGRFLTETEGRDRD